MSRQGFWRIVVFLSNLSFEIQTDRLRHAGRSALLPMSMQHQAARSTPRCVHRSNGSSVTFLDGITEVLLGAMIVFSPWAFGTTQPWSIHVMNAGGYALGCLFLAKSVMRRSFFAPAPTSVNRLRGALLVGSGLILVYALVAALNAEFTYVASEFRREPHPYIPWLPHSHDRLATWRLSWNWLALTCVFWAVHDWLTGDVRSDGTLSGRRLRRLVWVLALNGALVALEGILQRSSGTAKLLWFQPTHDNQIASAQFGPYAYRA